MNECPYLKNLEIWEIADRFRVSLGPGYSAPPIDTVAIAEIKLGLDLIEVPGLFTKIKMDAALLPDLTGIYVDKKSYQGWEDYKPWIERRLRFSIAHELGHYELHRGLIKRIKPDSYAEFKSWQKKVQDYTQARNTKLMNLPADY